MAQSHTQLYALIHLCLWSSDITIPWDEQHDQLERDVHDHDSWTVVLLLLSLKLIAMYMYLNLLSGIPCLALLL